MRTRIAPLAGAMVVCAYVSVVVCSHAAPVTLYIDSSRSSLTLSGAAFGLPVSQQAGHPGSLLDAWSGTITADLTGSVLTFGGGSSITALLNTPAAPPFSTVPYPTVPPGSMDNYGVFSSGLVTGVGLVTGLNGAYRSLTFDITAGTATQGAAPSGMTLGFTDGHLEWGAIVSPNTPFGGSSSMVGVLGTNTSVSPVSWDGMTLSLPVAFHTIGANRYEDWSGRLVAAVPEPSSVTLALLGAGLLAAKRCARKRQR
jgi:hypothetical protein